MEIYFSSLEIKSTAKHLNYSYRDRPFIAARLEALAALQGSEFVTEVQQVLQDLDEVASRKSEVVRNATIASVSIAGEYSVTYETGKGEGDNLNRIYKEKIAELVNLIEIAPNYNQSRLIRS